MGNTLFSKWKPVFLQNLVFAKSPEMCYHKGNIYFLAPAIMAEKIIDALTHNPALQEKRRTMLENMEPYTVGLGDTVASIAHKCGIEDYHDLVILNRLMGNDLKVRGKNGSNILIHV